MTKYIPFFIVFVTLSVDLFPTEIKENKLRVEKAKVVFLSEAPHETIKGTGDKLDGFIDLQTKKISMKFELSCLSTGMGLRDDHMHENYLESKKYPTAVYDASITSYDPKTGLVRALGAFALHGVTKESVMIEGIVSKSKKEGYIFKANFTVILSDYNIKIPKLVILKLDNKIKIQTVMQLKGEK